MTDSEQPDTPDRITAVAGKLALVVARINRRMLRATEDLTPGELSALASVVALGPLRLNTLAQREGIAPATVTRIVASLESHGLVQREVDETDRRAFSIEATSAGREHIQHARSARTDVLASLLAELSPDDLSALGEALPVLEAVETAEWPQLESSEQ